ncbi:zinc finger protein 420-like [Pomacea canaliculata]|uniref:zinc finger protein 420-like n=1 Tax=Pomacea canaliculata TaxID=400727 RepID=UPI000D73A0D2|nr:zinc finger protein 420-like [Pomacea canaliculata]XP_025114314.1 zinc finger protein 420-like [Pomacea canaliculata]XP_025114315.1 zinc finger protein 420-like [Pomacea canaliculata]
MPTICKIRRATSKSQTMTSHQKMECGPISESDTISSAYANCLFQPQHLQCLPSRGGVQSMFLQNPEIEGLVELASGISQKAQQATMPSSLHCEFLHTVCPSSLHHPWSQQIASTHSEPMQSIFSHSHLLDVHSNISVETPLAIKEMVPVTARALELMQPAQVLLHLQQQTAHLEALQSTLSQNADVGSWGCLPNEALTHGMSGMEVTSLEGGMMRNVNNLHQPMQHATSLLDAGQYAEVKAQQNLGVQIPDHGSIKDVSDDPKEESCGKHLERGVRTLRKDEDVYPSACYLDDHGAKHQCESNAIVSPVPVASQTQPLPEVCLHASYLQASQLLCELSETVAASKNTPELKSDKAGVAQPDKKGFKGGRPYQCSVCRAAFKQLSHLKGHLISHTSDRPYNCSSCKGAFKRRSDLNCHQKAVHDEPLPHSRHRTAVRKNCVLNKNVLTRSSKQAYQCTKCKAAFRTRYLLKKHSLVHINEKNYQCSEQNFTSTQIGRKSHRQIRNGGMKSGSPVSRAVGERQTHVTVTPCAEISLKASQLLSELSETVAANTKSSRIRPKRKSIDDDDDGGGDRPYQCSICKAAFKLASHLKGHMVVHSSLRPYKCMMCDFSFKKKYLLKNHMVVHSSERPYRCNDCDGTFKRFKDVKSHKSIHCKRQKSDSQVVMSPGEHQRQLEAVNNADSFLTFSGERAKGNETGDSAYQCIKCSVTFNQVSQLKSHMLSHSGDRPHQCTECKFAFTSAADLNLHRTSSHSDDRPYECSECEATFKTKSLLKNHKMWVHSNERPHQCSDCKAAFKTKSRLKSHKLIHSSERPFKCSLCTASFKKSIYLRGHMQSHSTERPFQCTECESSFKRFQDLKFHRMIHSGEKPYSCDECGLAFRKLGYLKSHLLIHNDDKPFQCCECQAAFKRSAALKFHQLVHGDDKPYRCSECNAAFNKLAQLNEHTIIHTGHAPARPYQCSICRASFKSSFDLKKHMNTHSSERPHQCSECKAYFKSMFTLRNHMITHSSERPHQCTECNAAFKTSYRLKKHTLVHTSTRVEMFAECF